MQVLETRAFRIALTIATIITLFFALRQCSTDETAATEVREEAPSDTIDAAATPTFVVSVEPTAPVIVQATPIASQAPNILVYSVESGDTLQDIAIKFNTSMDVITRANPSVNPNALQIGQKLQLPGVTLDPSELANPGADREEGETVNYFVEEGDSLGNIANEYTVTLQALLEANPGIEPAFIQVGQKIVVPPIGSGFDPTELTPQPTITPIPRAIGEPQLEIVQPGDTLLGIATKWGVTLDDLMFANDIEDADNIFIGLTLTIPPPS